MGRISEETIAQVAAANDVVDVIGSYLQLKRAGTSWRGLCPFHQERTPSFHVNPVRQNYHCFGCGAGGSVFRFVMEYEHVDFPESVRRLARRVGIEIAEETGEDLARRGQRERLLFLHKDVAAWFHANLMRRPIGAGAREYLKARGINSEIATRWQLGFAPESWDALTLWARNAGFTNDELSRSGLVSERDGGGGIYDRFRNRVIFPICSDFGEVIAFSGRTLGDDPAKYVNSPETPIFSKGRVLFGLDRTKRAIIEANEAIVCEGQLDLITMFEAGIQNVIAPQGTAFTERQASLVRRFAESVVLCFDSDRAGQTAVERSLPALLASGVGVRVARIPQGEDPDSLIRNQGAAALRSIVQDAPDYFDEAISRGLATGDNPRTRATLAGKLASFVSLIRDPALREGIANRVRSRLEVSASAFAELVAKSPKVQSDSAEEPPEEIVPPVVIPESARLIYRLALGSGEVRDWLRQQEARPSSLGSEFSLLDQILDSNLELEEPAVFTTFCARLSGPEERLLFGLRDGRMPEDPVSVARDAWRGISASLIKARIDRLHAQARRPGLNLTEITELNKQTLDLQRRLNELRKPFSS